MTSSRRLNRVGLNLLYLVPGNVGGSEVLARRLVDALARARPDVEFYAYAGREAAPSLDEEGWPANVRICEIAVTAARKPLRIATEIALLPAIAARHRVDLLHSLGTTSPPLLTVPGVTTILDLIYEHFPNTFPAPARLGLKLLVGPGARHADRVVAISHSVKHDVVSRLRVPADRVDVVHLGYGMRTPATVTPESDLRGALGLGDGRIVLCVSAALTHKNLDRLVDAFARLGEGCEDARLVVVGHGGRDEEALRTRAIAAGVGDRVVLTGWITAEDLEGLYRLATCCAYPSLHEGFGMPVLEAMARDVPIACSDATSLPEVAGDAALMFDPLDEDAIATAVRTLLTDREVAATLVARGRERVAHFTWERCAAGILDTYDGVLAASPSLRSAR